MSEDRLHQLAQNYKSAWVEVQELRVIRDELEAELVRLKEVFDAAMARYEAEIARNELPLMMRDPMVILERDRAIELAEIMLDEACRRAKEGR